MSNSELVNALIREHLHALKLEKTLEQFKQEVPNSNAITSRRDLAHQLGIRKLVKDNRTSDNPKKSHLEILASTITEKVKVFRANRHALKSTKGKIDETIGAEDTKCVDIPPFPTKPRHSVIDIENLNLSDEEECLPRYLAKNEPMSRVKSESGLIDFSDQDEIDLQQILLPPGSTSMSSAWKGKGFWFQSIPEISYGLQHSEKGPCGVVASVQAHIIKYLAYKVECLVNGKLWLKAGQTQSALCRAIKDILWNAKHQHCCLVLSTGISSGFGFLEISDEIVLLEAVSLNISQFLHAENQGDGLIQLLLSVVLSRSIPKLRSDMDWPDSSLLSKQLYCTQELVNLIISGRAISNLHDGEIDLAGQKLKGLTEPQDIGQLSLFEYYDNLKVGSFGKNPIYPIWVVCCESHYSVVFSPIKPIEEKTFDLLYYDGLLKPTKEILLSITQADYKPKETRELTPLLELVLGTKFDNVLVDWNGTEPIL